MFFTLALDGVAILMTVPTAVLFVEIVAALTLAGKESSADPQDNVRAVAVVLIPAHNESTAILPTLRDVKAQLRSGDRVIVVADNCDDDTAVVAATEGAEVIVRNEPTKAGKGYALDFGLAYLRAASSLPAIVIMIDADCRISEDALKLLTSTCRSTGRPIQALNLMSAPDQSEVNHSVAEFAWRVKNWIRPLGLSAFNLPCHLMGTGMAFPWNVICSVKLASGSVVEDLLLGLDLTALGSPPLFCPAARVSSQFPQSAAAAVSQRQRWEGGHLYTIINAFPRFLYSALSHANLKLFALTLDLAVPPLSILALILGMEVLITGIAELFGHRSVALAISSSCLAVFVFGIFISWLKYGRDILPVNAIFSIPKYVLMKLPIYRRLLSGSASLRWTRTDRD